MKGEAQARVAVCKRRRLKQRFRPSPKRYTLSYAKVGLQSPSGGAGGGGGGVGAKSNRA